MKNVHIGSMMKESKSATGYGCVTACFVISAFLSLAVFVLCTERPLWSFFQSLPREVDGVGHARN